MAVIATAPRDEAPGAATVAVGSGNEGVAGDDWCGLVISIVLLLRDAGSAAMLLSRGCGPLSSRRSNPGRSGGDATPRHAPALTTTSGSVILRRRVSDPTASDAATLDYGRSPCATN